jgi:hypothetical protein
VPEITLLLLGTALLLLLGLRAVLYMHQHWTDKL